MQFIDPQNKTTGVLSNGSVVVRRPGSEDATIQLSGLGSCPDDSFDKFTKPFTLVIKDAAGDVKFQIGMGY